MYLEKDNNELKNRNKEQERYRMKWCLHIRGLEEKESENKIVKVVKVVEIFREVAADLETKMDDTVDTVHRVGKKMDNKVRHIMVQFAKRLMKKEIWRRTKKSQVCQVKKIYFVLPLEDWGERRRFWPLSEQARRAGKVAFFWEPHGLIEGQQIND